MDVNEFLKNAIYAVEKEIEAVIERPSEEVLYNGKKTDSVLDGVRYIFDCSNASIQYAEIVSADFGDKTVKAVPVDFSDNKLTLSFDNAHGKEIDSVHLSWENDFILQRIKSRLKVIQTEEDSESYQRISRMLRPEPVEVDEAPSIFEDGKRNEAQINALKMSAVQPVCFIWGPPGTGKTSTLGYIIANYLKRGKRVLFVSNTNRAVDIGLISTIEAVTLMDVFFDLEHLTRYGEAALPDYKMEMLLFENQIQKFVSSRKEKAIELAGVMDRWKLAEKETEQKLRDGYHLSDEEEAQLLTLQTEVKRQGGEAALEERIANLATRTPTTDFIYLKKKQLVSTTLAKVCTSDLLQDEEFDAVVVDESSMASLPYLLVMASMAREHLVLVGDPMQLPPIAITNDFKAKDFLEQDIYSLLSGAQTPGEQFRWHDENPEITSFFDTQFRLQQDLADIISEIFYEGRLKSDISKTEKKTKSKSAHVIDSSSLEPEIIQDDSKSGFRPENKTHAKIVIGLLRKLEESGHANRKDIGIIVPFRSVAWTLRQKLSEAGFDGVETGTIHTFQGREKQIIIFDTVMAADVSNGFPRHYSVRPFDENKNGLSVARLLNVAFSRCQQNMFVIADMNHINRVYQNKFIHRLLNSLNRFSVSRLGHL